MTWTGHPVYGPYALHCVRMKREQQARCEHEQINNTNPVRSPMAEATYECDDCGVAMIETEPGSYEPVES